MPQTAFDSPEITYYNIRGSATKNVVFFNTEGALDDWERQCLPIGNSYTGASLFGGVRTERVVLNEKILRTGALALQGKSEEAVELMERGLPLSDNEKQKSTTRACCAFCT